MEAHDVEEEPVRIFGMISMVVPEGATTGTKLLYDAPDGQELRLTVPEGVGPGSVMSLEQDPVSKVWRCMADPARSPEPEPASAAREAGDVRGGSEEEGPRTYVEPFARMYASGRDTPRMATLPRVTPVLEHQAVQRPVKLSTVLLPAGPVAAVPKVPSFTPPPLVMRQDQRASCTPAPQAPGYAPPPTALVQEQRLSYTPPPQALLEQRPSYTPPPAMVLPAEGPLPPGVFLARMPAETIQLGATYLLPSATPPRVTVSVTHHTQSSPRLHTAGTIAAAGGAAPASGGSLHVPPAGLSGAGSVMLPPPGRGHGGPAAVAQPPAVCPAARAQAPEVRIVLPAPPGASPGTAGRVLQGGQLSPMVQPRLLLPAAAHPGAGPPPRVAAVAMPCRH